MKRCRTSVKNPGGARKVCHLCRVTLVLSWPEHLDTLRHQAARKLACAALSRLRSSLEPPSTTDETGTATTLWTTTTIPSPIPGSPIFDAEDERTVRPESSEREETDADENAKEVFCSTCIWPVIALDSTHFRSEQHMTAFKFEQLLEVLVRDYAEEEDLALMDIPPKEPGPVKYVTETENYRCNICNICDVLKQFRAEHENSIHHRANLACAQSAIKRIRAHLAPDNDADLPLEDHKAEDLRLLLKAYVKH